MSRSRLAVLVLLWAVVLLVGAQVTLTPAVLFQLPVLAFVAGLPLLAGLACHGPGAVRDAFRDALSPDAADLPSQRRSTGASTLRSLGGMAVAAGMLGFVGALIATLTLVTATAGSVHPNELLAAVPGMLLAPIYGLSLKCFLLDVLAGALEAAEPGLGVALDEE